MARQKLVIWSLCDFRRDVGMIDAGARRLGAGMLFYGALTAALEPIPSTIAVGAVYVPWSLLLGLWLAILGLWLLMLRPTPAWVVTCTLLACVLIQVWLGSSWLAAAGLFPLIGVLILCMDINISREVRDRSEPQERHFQQQRSRKRRTR